MGEGPRRLRLEPARRALAGVLGEFERNHPVSVVDMLELIGERQRELLDYVQRHPRAAHFRSSPGE